MLKDYLLKAKKTLDVGSGIFKLLFLFINHDFFYRKRIPDLSFCQNDG